GGGGGGGWGGWFVFGGCGARGELHSFPTRRSSDLTRSAFSPAPSPRSLTKAAADLPPVAFRPYRFMALSTRRSRRPSIDIWPGRSEEHTSELQSLAHLVCRPPPDKNTPPPPPPPPP